MKSTGIIRKLDELGRIVIPIEMRRTFEIDQDTPIEIFVSEDQIILKKHDPSCIFCHNTKSLLSFKGKNVCATCARELR